MEIRAVSLRVSNRVLHLQDIHAGCQPIRKRHFLLGALSWLRVVLIVVSVVPQDRCCVEPEVVDSTIGHPYLRVS